MHGCDGDMTARVQDHLAREGELEFSSVARVVIGLVFELVVIAAGALLAGRVVPFSRPWWWRIATFLFSLMAVAVLLPLHYLAAFVSLQYRHASGISCLISKNRSPSAGSRACVAS